MRFPFSSPKNSARAANPAVNRKTKLVIGLLASVLILATATAATFRARRAKPVAKAVAIPEKPQPPEVQERSKGELEVLPLQLRSAGFVPREITRPPGQYFFSIGNQSGVADINLRLDREQGGRLKEAQVKGQRLRWRDKVRLTPGTYFISEASHPDWLCRIVIKPE